MKSTENFKKVIHNKLIEMGESDPLFAVNLEKENKSIDGCINYILNTVKDSGCVGFTDDEVFAMAAHYYDEDDIKDGKLINCKVVVNHAIELTPDEVSNAKKLAIEKVVAQEREKILKRAIKAKENLNVQQGSLF